MLPYLLVIVVVVIGSREAVRKRLGAPAALGIPYVRGRARRLSVARRLFVVAGVEAEQLHLDVVAGVELELARCERRCVVRAWPDRRELDDHSLVALDERVDQELVRPRLELEVLERVDVQRDRERREVGRDIVRSSTTIRSTQPVPWATMSRPRR